MEVVEVVAAAADGIAGIVTAAWYAKSKSGGHLAMAICFLFVAAVFGYLAAT